MSLLSVKMRASVAGKHVSGAEKIVPSEAVARTVAQLTERALTHEKGPVDFINLKVESCSEILRLKSLAVTTNVTRTPEEGLARAAELLKGAGITRIAEIMARFSETYTLRGAMLLDADTLERLEVDHSRGVRATYMDDGESLIKGTASGKNHYAEAIVLATKVQHAPNIVGEICVSDDPNYVTGYVATREIGYQRITVLKRRGDERGGRIFLYRGPHEEVAETIRFLEQQAVIVEDVPLPSPVAKCERWDSMAEELEERREAGLYRSAPTPIEAADEINLASNDYLGLSREQRVIEAVQKALSEGFGSTGSRLTTGTHQSHLQLEEHLARFKGAEAALLFATGYMANVGTIQAMVGKGDVILSDELNHASIIDGCRLSGADVLVYRHNDWSDLERKLAGCCEHRRRLVVSDAVFSMDGDIVDLPRWLAICKRYDAFSMIDEAHATGVLGATGRGLVEHFGCEHPDIVLGTLSKALGGEGGFVAGSRLLIDYLRNRARSFIFSTAMSGAVAAGVDAALTLLEREPERVERLRTKVRRFIAELAARGVTARTDSAIVPIVIGDERRAMEAAKLLKAKGFLVSAIRYPTVARGAARLRVAIASEIPTEELVRAAEAISSIFGKPC